MTDRNPDADVQKALEAINHIDEVEQWAIKRSAEYRLIADFIEDDDVDGIDGNAQELRLAAEQIEKLVERVN